jgi:hypothetical protein
MSDNTKIWITAIIAVTLTTIVAITVAGWVLGEPTHLIP